MHISLKGLPFLYQNMLLSLPPKLQVSSHLFVMSLSSVLSSLYAVCLYPQLDLHGFSASWTDNLTRSIQRFQMLE